MPRVKKDQSPKREPPVQLRPGPDLGRLLHEFATRHDLQPNEACKCLVVLALTEMDCRFYGLVNQLALAMGGSNAFVHACTHVQAALAGAGRLRGQPIRFDPERAVFILQTVRDFLADRGLQVEEHGLWFLPQEQGREEEPGQARTRQPHQSRRRISRRAMDQVQELLQQEQDALGPGREEAAEEEVASEPEKQRHRSNN
jgi:hypothetical protein